MVRRPTKKELYGTAIAGAGLLAFGAWWWLHDPFRGLDSHITYDQTTRYLATDPLFSSPRRVRLVFVKDMSVSDVLASLKPAYSSTAGWQWRLDRLPKSFAAFRRRQGDRLPEQISALKTPEGTVELVESRDMSPAEVQFVKRTEGSDAFISYPDVPRERPQMSNPRLAFAP